MWQKYQRKGLSEMRPYEEGEDLSKVSISDPDKRAGSPKQGDMIARNPKNYEDQWLVAQKYFEDNLELAIHYPDECEDDSHDPMSRTIPRLSPDCPMCKGEKFVEWAFPSKGRGPCPICNTK